MRKHEVVVRMKFVLGTNRHTQEYYAICKKWRCRWKARAVTQSGIIERGIRHVKLTRRQAKSA